MKIYFQSRAVAKPGIALAWGARGPEFKSRQPDQNSSISYVRVSGPLAFAASCPPVRTVHAFGSSLQTSFADSAEEARLRPMNFAQVAHGRPKRRILVAARCYVAQVTQ